MRHALIPLAVLLTAAAEPGCSRTIEDICYEAGEAGTGALDVIDDCDAWLPACDDANDPGEGTFPVDGLPFRSQTGFHVNTERYGRPCDMSQTQMYMHLDADGVACELSLHGVDETMSVAPGVDAVPDALAPIDEPRRYLLECWDETLDPVFVSAFLFIPPRGTL